MAIALWTYIAGGETHRIRTEQEAHPRFTQIFLIDPDKVITVPDVAPAELHQRRETLDSAILFLHERHEQVIGLLANSQHFEAVLGADQVLDIGPLKAAIQTLPKQPIALNLFTSEPPDKIPPLLLMSARQNDVYHLPMVSVEFCPNPRWASRATLDNPQLILREPGLKRGQIIFYTHPSMPPGLGFVERQQSDNTFALLCYQESKQFQISGAAVEVMDRYFRNLDLATGRVQRPS